MNPVTPIAPTNPLGYPAPFWFLEFFKVLGFTLHMVPMNLWYAGMVVVAVLGLFGRDNPRRLAHRLIGAMPIVIALGINFGIVPLLFTQVAYYQVYYPAGILMAWPWLSVIILLTLAYYGVYIYATEARKGQVRWWGMATGWVSAVLFVVIGFLFANNFSLMTDIDAWVEIFQRSSVSGAPTGLALNLGDATLFPRWLLMFGLALTTTAVYVTIDAAFFAGDEREDYRCYAARFAAGLYTLGLVWFAVMGSWYIFGTVDPAMLAAARARPLILLLGVLTAVGPGLPWLLLVAQRRGVDRRLAALAGVAQFGVLALNAISRQWLQNAEIGRYLAIGQEPVNTQWSPLILFLILFLIGLAIIGWMVSQVIAVNRVSAGT